MTAPEQPWYKRSLLPPWMPEWLAVSVLIAAGFGAAFGLLLDTPAPWRTGLVAGAIGFGLALVILTIAAAKGPKTPDGQRIAPPAVIRRPILTALVAIVPLRWAVDGWIDLSPRAGLLIKGAAADCVSLAGLVLVAVAAALVGYVNCRRERRIGPSWVAAVAVAVGAFAWGAVAVAVRHS